MPLAHSSLVYYRNNNTRHSLAQFVSDMSLVAYQTLIVPTHDSCYYFYDTLVMSALIRHTYEYAHELCQRMTSFIVSIIHK